MCGRRGKDRDVGVVAIYFLVRLRHIYAWFLLRRVVHCRVHPGSSHEVKWSYHFCLGVSFFRAVPCSMRQDIVVFVNSLEVNQWVFVLRLWKMHPLLIGGPRRTNGHERPIKREHVEQFSFFWLAVHFFFVLKHRCSKKERRDHLILQGKCK